MFSFSKVLGTTLDSLWEKSLRKEKKNTDSNNHIFTATFSKITKVNTWDRRMWEAASYYAPENDKGRGADVYKHS